MQNIEINIHGFRFIEIETGYVAKPNRTAINRVPLSALMTVNISLTSARENVGRKTVKTFNLPLHRH